MLGQKGRPQVTMKLDEKQYDHRLHCCCREGGCFKGPCTERQEEACTWFLLSGWALAKFTVKSASAEDRIPVSLASAEVNFTV